MPDFFVRCPFCAKDLTVQYGSEDMNITSSQSQPTASKASHSQLQSTSSDASQFQLTSSESWHEYFIGAEPYYESEPAYESAYEPELPDVDERSSVFSEESPGITYSTKDRVIRFIRNFSILLPISAIAVIVLGYRIIFNSYFAINNLNQRQRSYKVLQTMRRLDYRSGL
jgi:hypothetical protein